MITGMDTMIEKMDGTHIGDLCFKGLKENGNPEIGYGILDEFQGQGYATEAVKLALRWAFGRQDHLKTAKLSIDYVKVKTAMPSDVDENRMKKCRAPALVMGAEKDCLFPGRCSRICSGGWRKKNREEIERYLF